MKLINAAVLSRFVMKINILFEIKSLFWLFETEIIYATLDVSSFISRTVQHYLCSA
jgi:hypothetical protein